MPNFYQSDREFLFTMTAPGKLAEGIAIGSMRIATKAPISIRSATIEQDKLYGTDAFIVDNRAKKSVPVDVTFNVVETNYGIAIDKGGYMWDKDCSVYEILDTPSGRVEVYFALRFTNGIRKFPKPVLVIAWNLPYNLECDMKRGTDGWEAELEAIVSTQLDTIIMKAHDYYFERLPRALRKLESLEDRPRRRNF